MIAKSLGIDKEKIAIPKPTTINQLLSTQQIPEELNKDLGGSKGKSFINLYGWKHIIDDGSSTCK